MTTPPDPLALIEALEKRVKKLEKDAEKAENRSTRHLRDHAASGYDFRRAQKDSPNERPPDIVNDYDEPSPNRQPSN